MRCCIEKGSTVIAAIRSCQVLYLSPVYLLGVLNLRKQAWVLKNSVSFLGLLVIEPSVSEGVQAPFVYSRRV